MRKTLECFIQHLRDEDFAGAHEVMEHQWKAYKKEAHPLTKLLKGYINGATAFEVLRRGKTEGAKHLWGVYKKYLPALQEDIEAYDLFAIADGLLWKLAEERLSDI